MIEKIKVFFQNKIVKTVAWAVVSVDVAALIIGGARTVKVSGGIVCTAGVIAAAALAIAVIAERIGNKK